MRFIEHRKQNYFYLLNEKLITDHRFHHNMTYLGIFYAFSFNLFTKLYQPKNGYTKCAQRLHYNRSKSASKYLHWICLNFNCKQVRVDPSLKFKSNFTVSQSIIKYCFSFVKINLPTHKYLNELLLAKYHTQTHKN